MTRYDRRAIALALAVSATAGYVDAVTYLSSGQFFASFMSGNSTRLGIELGQGKFGAALTFLGVVALFVTGVVLGALVAGKARARRKSAVLCLAAGILVLAALASGRGDAQLSSLAAVLALGVENATFQRKGDVSIGLTYVTGTLVRCGHRIALALRGGPRWTWVPYGLLWMSLILGAALGSVMHQGYAGLSLWLSAGVTFLLGILASRVSVRFP